MQGYCFRQVLLNRLSKKMSGPIIVEKSSCDRNWRWCTLMVPPVSAAGKQILKKTVSGG